MDLGRNVQWGVERWPTRLTRRTNRKWKHGPATLFAERGEDLSRDGVGEG
jgi:hypothetical protein